ncbi:hypothetical protein TDB9533_01266 [Thalassocella blandensis]|nr:hypothetical protein TDB9533_01266 [Thalassocella blandensis]
MDKHQIEIIEIALNKLLNKQGFFSICEVDRLAKTLGTNCEAHPDYKFLSALHCTSYADMSNDLKTKLPKMIMNVLSSRFDTSLIAKALAAVASGEVKDLPIIEDTAPPANRIVKLFR